LSFDDASVSVNERNIDREFHTDRVYPVAGFNDESTSERSSAE